MSGDAFQGLQGLDTFGSEYNAQYLFVRSILAGVHTATLVKIVACSNTGGVSPAGTVDVQPLVNLVDGDGNKTSHGVIYKLPYFRLQGGANAVIIDPQVGDIGLAIFAERDISTAIATKAQANPGSGRWFDMADGVYIGGILNGAPVQYVRFSAGGIDLVTPYNLTAQVAGNLSATVAGSTTLVSSGNTDITTPTLTLHGDLIVTGTITA